MFIVYIISDMATFCISSNPLNTSMIKSVGDTYRSLWEWLSMGDTKVSWNGSGPYSITSVSTLVYVWEIQKSLGMVQGPMTSVSTLVYVYVWEVQKPLSMVQDLMTSVPTQFVYWRYRSLWEWFRTWWPLCWLRFVYGSYKILSEWFRALWPLCQLWFVYRRYSSLWEWFRALWPLCRL